MSAFDPFKDIQPYAVRCEAEVQGYSKATAESIAKSLDDAAKARGPLPWDAWLQREMIRRIHGV